MAPVAVEPKREASPGSPSPKALKASSSSPVPPTDAIPSTSKRTIEEEEDLEAHLLFPDTPHPPPHKKRVWVPTLHLTQPPQPPQPDPRTVAEMAAQSAATALGYEGRRIKKFMQRRTVDYFGAFSHLRTRQTLSTTVRPDGLLGGLYPSPHSIPSFLLTSGYPDLTTSLPTHLVHTSTNKIRCPVNVVRWMPDGRRLLTGSTSGEFTLWNGLTFNFETIMQAHDSAVRAMAWSKSGAFLISADQNGSIKYHQGNLNTLQAFQGHGDSARGLAWGPDDGKFVSCGDDSLIKVWDFDSAKQIRELSGHGWDVKCVDWHATKGLLVSGSKDNLVKVWDPRATPSGTCLATFHNHKNTVQSVLFSPDGLRFASASRDMTVKIYDLRMMAEQLTLKGHVKEVCSLAFHPLHHDLLASGGSEGSLLYWDLRGASAESLSATNWGESRMTGGGGEGMDVGEGRRSDEWLTWKNETAHESNVWSLAWHPMGHVLASGSNDHMTRFWERARPEESVQVQGGGVEVGGSFLHVGGGDDSFIPGLGAGRSFIPTNEVKMEMTESAGGIGGDDFAIPGLGFASNGMAPPPPPPQQQYGMGGAGGFTPGTGANAPLPGAAGGFGWTARGQQAQQGQQGQQGRPGGTYGSFY
ncbi:WD40 repeat [Kalmanozyma brasiliensis GHG001]|uniref:Polyadenylation factor subunit 2 n=1 Tax=Kalmanozyma brasiliensis (strain GHG001) TaxID=1365824 RepID=V5F2Z0_KALBG|nr:WD40 repeat [Kalmanozyma brasiliensis GHG001]EST09844.1 WD40 repeat [Kalmanozyma brasiliensis GHG001]